MTSSYGIITIRGLLQGHRQEIERIARDDDPDPASPDDMLPPIVERRAGGYAVIDGFHRLAGLLAGGHTNWPIVVVENWPGLDTIDCDSPLAHPTIRAIYRAAESARAARDDSRDTL